MMHIRQRRKLTVLLAGPRTRHGIIGIARILAPVCLWWIEQAWGALVAALLVTTSTSAAGLLARRTHPHIHRSGISERLPRPVHVLTSGLRRVLWGSLFRALGGISVHGTLPRGACIVVANHRSHADTAALLAALPARSTPRVAASADHWFERRRRRYCCRWLAAGFPVRRTGGGYDDLAGARQFLAAGGVVIVFPEGSRNTGQGLASFHTGAFTLARETGTPIVAAALVGTSQVLAKNDRRMHRSRITLCFDTPRWPATAEETKKRLADMLQHHTPSATAPEPRSASVEEAAESREMREPCRGSRR
jgi:1-acyl-sn-glycerol-3-phosphate acyltransferase